MRTYRSQVVGILSAVALGCTGTLVQVRTNENPLQTVADHSERRGYKIYWIDPDHLEIRMPVPVWRQLAALGTLRYQANLEYADNVVTGRFAWRSQTALTLFIPIYADSCNAGAKWTTSLPERIDEVSSMIEGDELQRECNDGYGWSK